MPWLTDAEGKHQTAANTTIGEDKLSQKSSEAGRKCLIYFMINLITTPHLKYVLKKYCSRMLLYSSHLTYIIGVDVPGHVAIGDQLTVDIATNLRVSPAVIDVDNADHVPLKHRQTH